MAFRQLGDQQTERILAIAAKRQIPVVITIRCRNQWTSLHSEFLGLEHHMLYVEPPREPGASVPFDLPKHEKVGVAFRIEPHKYTFAAHPGGLDDFNGTKAQALLWPEVVNATDRRVWRRLALPDGTARAWLWPGGREAEPKNMTPDRPVWSGRLADISVSGFQIVTGVDASRFLEPGDIVGVRLLFDDGSEPMYIDAQFRHAVVGRDIAHLGFQFAGVEQSDESMKTLEAIVDRIEGLPGGAGG